MKKGKRWGIKVASFFVIMVAAFLSPSVSAADLAAANVDTDIYTHPTTLLNEGGGTPLNFVWGAEMGSGIDMTAHDMTYTSLNAYFGFKNDWVKTLGIGASIYSMLNNSSRCYPVYAVFRSSFSRQKRLCFMDTRVGVTFNNIFDYKTQTEFFGSLGLGLNLAQGKKFSSYIVVSYTVMPMSGKRNAEGELTAYDHTIQYASVRFGCSF